jgi:hypothetical protein
VAKFPENVYNAGAYHARSSGLMGEQQQSQAQLEGFIFNAMASNIDTAAGFVAQNPDIVENYFMHHYHPNYNRLGGGFAGGMARGSALGVSATSNFGLTILGGYGYARGAIHDFVEKIK